MSEPTSSMETTPENPRIAAFISPHGYGHGARAAAVMEALYALMPAVEFEIFTQVPKWLFEESLSAPFRYHALWTDVGLVQETALRANLRETQVLLDRFLPLDSSLIDRLATTIHHRKCRLVMSDIAPMGIAVARKAGVPSVLVENFTWDWIYAPYSRQMPEMKKHVHYLKDLFHLADLHIQTEPVCRRQKALLLTPPISRKPKKPREAVRRRLGVPLDSKMVLITMGGIPEAYPFLDRLAQQRRYYFVIPGAREEEKRVGNLVLLPTHCDIFHPDLVRASDAVVGKAGYSTLAETHDAAVPFGYVSRSGFRESHVLTSFIKSRMTGLPIGENEFYEGAWSSRLPELLALPRGRRRARNGREQAARFIQGLITRESR